MLTCVHHPIDPMRVVEEEEADRLKATGFWFDCPQKARQYRQNVVDNANRESKVAEITTLQPKGKLKERRNERK